MKYNIESCDPTKPGRLISKVFYPALGILLLALAGVATGDEVKIKRIGDRVPLYESASIYYLKLAEDLPKADEDGPPDLDEWANGIQHQAAMYAFMFFIDRSRAQTLRDDAYNRGLIRVTRTLMKKVDWVEFEEYVGNMGFGYVSGFFDGYKKEMIPEDLRKFKEFLRVPLKDQKPGAPVEVIDETSPSNDSGPTPRQPQKGEPPSKPRDIPK